MSKTKQFKHSKNMQKYSKRAKAPAITMTLENDNDMYELLYSIDGGRSNNPYRVAYSWMHGRSNTYPKEILHVRQFAVIKISNGKMITRSNGASVWKKK